MSGPGTPRRVVVWSNGAVLVFDAVGQQCPDYQHTLGQDDARARALARVVAPPRWRWLIWPGNAPRSAVDGWLSGRGRWINRHFGLAEDAEEGRRAFLRGLAGAGAGAAGLAIAASIPAAVAAAGHSAYCGAPYGPLHRYLAATSPDYDWAHAIIWRESNWDPSATNPASGAAGLAQFMPYIWAWLVDEGLAYGSPYDGYANIDAMNACLRRGWYWMWNL